MKVQLIHVPIAVHSTYALEMKTVHHCWLPLCVVYEAWVQTNLTQTRSLALKKDVQVLSQYLTGSCMRV